MLCSVCIATYKRQDLLEELLNHLVLQILPREVRLEIIIVDNDQEGSARSIVKKVSGTKKIQLHYLMQSIKNISLTRNTGVAYATGDYILFIDDDEYPCQDWIFTFIKCINEYNVDGIFGPIVPIFSDTTPDWMKNSNWYYGSFPSITGSEATTLWTSNCIVKSSLLKEIEGPFDIEYGITGGEDTDLFSKLKTKGARFLYCHEASVYEYLPPNRTKLEYLWKRSFRGGNIHTRRMICTSTGSSKIAIRLFMFIKSILLSIASLLFIILIFPNKIWRTTFKLKLASNAGRFMSVFGWYYKAYK